MQAAMLGVSTPQLAAAISNQGGLGSLAAGNMSEENTLALIRETKKLTSRPFAVNLFINEITPAGHTEEFYIMQSFLKKYCEKNNIPYEINDLSIARSNSYKDQIEVLIEENIEIVSFTFGVLDDQNISALKSNGTKLIGTATSINEATLLQDKGIDVVIAQSMEAGGHSGSFLNYDKPHTDAISLIPMVTDMISIPVLAAGGITDARSFKTAIALGASGVVAGSIFIPSHESMASELYKNNIQSHPQRNTVLSKAFTGKWSRAIKNDFISAIEDSGLLIPSFREQLQLTEQIRTFAINNQRADLMPIWVGQSSSTYPKGAAADIMMLLLTADT